MKTNLFKYYYSITILLFFSCQISLSDAQTSWYKYPGNPVFKHGESGEWDYLIFSPSIIHEDSIYHLWYVGMERNSQGQGSVGYATSKDGIHWEKFDGIPLKFKCEGEAWDNAFLVVNVLKKDSMYYMWYTGESKENWLDLFIGYAWSKDGINWTKHPEPVLNPGKDDDWDALYVSTPKVMFNVHLSDQKGTQFHMWYTGVADHMPRTHRVGYATSDDGFHWKKFEGNPVMNIGKAGTWDSRWVVASTIIFNGASYEMWYYGFNDVMQGIGYATSKDGVSWNKYPWNPILEAGELGAWDSWYATYGQVESIGDSVYKMWYCGNNHTGENFGYATTSIAEAETWATTKIPETAREVMVTVFNKTKFIRLDSLLQILPELSGTELIDAYNDLALAYVLNDEEKSFYYAENALELAKKICYPKGKGMALYNKGICQYAMDNYGDALNNQLSALRIFDSLGMLYEVGNLLSQIASIHAYAGSYDLASRFYKQSLENFEKLNDTGFILLTLEYLANTYLEIQDTDRAIVTLRKRLFRAKEYHDIWTIAETYRRIGESYKGLVLDSSINYLKEAQKIWDTLYFIGKGYNYLKTAEAYYSFGPGYYQETEEYFLKCYDIFKFEGRESKIMLIYGLAELYLNTGRYEKVKAQLELALELCQVYLARQNHQMFASIDKKMENEIYLKTYMEKTYRLYFRLDTTLKDDNSAWKHLTLAQQWNDSIYNQQNRRQWAMLQGQYETESTQRHIEILQKENEVQTLIIKQSRIYLFALTGFILILALVAVLFIRQRKIRIEHTNLIREQKLLHDLELKNMESEKLKELDHLKSRFFANISHEFRTPLTLILGPLEKLLSKTKDDADKKELGIAKKYAGKLQILINNLLAISKLESGNMQLHASETDIVKLVNNYIQGFESLAKQKNIALNFKSEYKKIEA
ncbi:MAG: histidine kinase dimerization/phospho-acceptor domain-containing protein, partial [Bacteroidales bacterium]